MAEDGHKVSLHVYDLSQGLARQMSAAFLGKTIEGIWHTGVVVYGNEYYFGGGIQHAPVGSTPYGTPLQVLDLGVTHLPEDVFESYLLEISPRYTAETYSLLTHNCNNFSNEVAQFLVGATIPEYILNLPNEVMSSPMGALMLPMIQQMESTLRAGAVPQAPMFRPAAVAAAVAPPSASLSEKIVASNSTLSEDTKKHNGVDSRKQNARSNGVLPACANPAPANVTTDPLGDARSKIQGEIAKEFDAIMATGTMRASEAATLATKKVMQKYGHGTNAAQS
ncbi:unnamed protein product [Cuscuta campestris]|uniref:PPPDE domain-containing protein n=1 Tax=Cuscuta campestris TaxID=132261 RepID=A0A484KY02_9ASTE|nr:unnamed protein product [Cuscuta campestris]